MGTVSVASILADQPAKLEAAAGQLDVVRWRQGCKSVDQVSAIGARGQELRVQLCSAVTDQNEYPKLRRIAVENLAGVL